MKLTKLITVNAMLLVLAASLVWSKERAATATGSFAGKEYVYFTVKMQNCHLLVFTSDADKFLANPVAALRADGIAVPPPAEVHWRAVTVALRRLANSDLPPSSQSLSSRPGLGILKSQIARFELPGGWIPVAGDWNGDGTVTGRDFMADPVRTLRAQRLAVSTSDETSWRQLAEALKSLRAIYTRPTAGLNRPAADQPAAQL